MRLLLYADEVNQLRDNTDTIKKYTGALIGENPLILSNILSLSALARFSQFRITTNTFVPYTYII
jgi:hypothetical protein